MKKHALNHHNHDNNERDDHTKTKHQTQTDKRKRNSTRKHQIIEPIMATASSQRVLANQGACQTTKGANAT
jgi:fatty acid desaturase